MSTTNKTIRGRSVPGNEQTGNSKKSPSAVKENREAAEQHRQGLRQAYTGNFFAGPHSIFHPLLFTRKKSA